MKFEASVRQDIKSLFERSCFNEKTQNKVEADQAYERLNYKFK